MFKAWGSRQQRSVPRAPPPPALLQTHHTILLHSRPPALIHQPTNAPAGTSLTMHYAMDDANDVLIAYKQNGRWLTPDHGFPVRIIIPGFIGGRMVKWLEEITVTPAESDNFYHFHDNRVMPPHVDEELAKKEGAYVRPRDSTAPQRLCICFCCPHTSHTAPCPPP